jgi:cellulase/cellobiase CelA1
LTRSSYAIAIAATLLLALGTFLAARAISPGGPPAPVSDSPAAAGTSIDGSPLPSSPAPTSPGSPASPAPPGAASCSAAYSVVGNWPGGFQGKVVVTNTGAAALNGWQLGWTFPGGQAISTLWNGGYTQSGSNVTVISESYNGKLAPGASTTVGFTATNSGGGTAPSSVSCT